MIAEEPVVTTIINIFRTLVQSSLPLYESKFEQLATGQSPDVVNTVRNDLLPELRAIFSNVERPTEMLARLSETYSTMFFLVLIDADFLVTVDMILDEIYRVFKTINDEIILREKRQCRSDLIADMFHDVKCDIGGGAFELQHRIDTPYTGNVVPWREFYHFKRKFAASRKVLEALEYKLSKYI